MSAYQKITEPGEIKKILDLVINKNLLLRVSAKENDNEYDFDISLKPASSFESNSNENLMVFVPKEHREYLKNNNPFLCFFVNVGAAYYLKLKIVDSMLDGFFCTMPDLVFRVQRRKYYRLNVEDMNFRIGYKDALNKEKQGLIIRKVLDIGIGGCSFVIPDKDSDNLQLGEQLHGFKLKIDKNFYISPLAVVRFLGAVTDGHGSRILKCGVEFIKFIHPEEEQLYSYKVYSMQREEVLKYSNL